MVHTLERKSNPAVVSDFHDGQVYKHLAILNAQPSEELNLSSVFKSTNQSFWTVLLMLNELPFSERFETVVG